MAIRESKSASCELKRCMLWHNTNQDINRLIQLCDVCQEHQKMQSAETLMSHEIQVRPWQIVATDVFHFDGSNFIFIMDYYSKYPCVWKLSNFSNQEVINTTKQAFGENRFPEKGIRDNVPYYNSAAYKQCAKQWGFEYRTSSPKYPQSNGLAERCVQSMKSGIKKA